MSADLVAAVAILIAGVVWATRGNGDALSRWVELHDERRDALRPPVRPSVSAVGRPVSPFAGAPGPRAIEWVDAELVPDLAPVERAALERYPVIEVAAHDVEPLPAPARRALPGRRLAIEPPHPRSENRGESGELGSVTVHALLVTAAGIAIVLIVTARLVGAA